jgi:hypothetical protein
MCFEHFDDPWYGIVYDFYESTCMELHADI